VARILVVEDEESWSDALSYLLRREGFEVTVAATGSAALTEFDRGGADLVLLDLMLRPLVRRDPHRPHRDPQTPESRRIRTSTASP
jgi:DNA-binding response OmpR family regulator